MPVINPNQSTVNVPVPVVAPADTKPKTAPGAKPAAAPVPAGNVAPVPALPPALRAVIMPWVPQKGKQQLSRRRPAPARYSRTTPYTPQTGRWWAKVTNHGSVYGGVDHAAAGSLADWFQENDDWRHHLLRHVAEYESYDRAPVLFSRPDGKVYQYGSNTEVPKTVFHESSMKNVATGMSTVAFGYDPDHTEPLVMVNTAHNYGQHMSVLTPGEYRALRNDAASAGVTFPEPPPSHRSGPPPETPPPEGVIRGKGLAGNLTAGLGLPDQPKVEVNLVRKRNARPLPPKRYAIPRPLKYSHEAFLPELARNPDDSTTRGVYADWLEENDPSAITPVHLHRLRHYRGRVWIGRSPGGKVLVIPHLNKEHAVELGQKLGSRLYHVSRRKSARGSGSNQAVEIKTNGKAQTWKRRPEEYRLPTRQGIYYHLQITRADESNWLIESPTEEPNS